jgi:signal transduction histidine kinase
VRRFFPRARSRPGERAILAILVVVALAAFVSTGVWPALQGGATPDARWQQIEADVRARLDVALDRVGSATAALAARPEVSQALAEPADGTQELFRAIEREVPDPAASLAVTIFDARGVARAWHGRPSELDVAVARSPGHLLATAGALGLRIVRLEPVVADHGRRLGVIVVEQVISEARVGGLMSDTFRLETRRGPVTIRPAGSVEPGATDRTFTVHGPSGEPLVAASAQNSALEAAIALDRGRAGATLIIAMSILVLLWTGWFLDRRARAGDARRYLAHTGAVALLVGTARVLLWFATPWYGALPLFAPRAVEGLAGLILRSPADLCLSAAALLAVAALLADVASRARAAWHGRRRWPAAARPAFLAVQVVTSAIAMSLLVVTDGLIRAGVTLTGGDALRLSLHPLSVERWASVFGLILLQAAAIWLAVATLVLGLAAWRVRRQPGAAMVPVAVWAVTAIAVAALAARSQGAVPSLSFAVSAAIAVGAGLYAPRAATRYRRAGATARLLAFGAAFLLPALIAYPALAGSSQERTRRLVEHGYSREALHHRVELQDTLQTALAEIDRLPDLEALVQTEAPGVTTEEAFVVWSQTALARARLTSNVELYGPDGRLVSRFALNFPEYEASAQVIRSATCTWEVFGEARPFGAEERAALHAERALCGPGEPAGSVVVHVMLDYNALPFISSESPYREAVRPERVGPDAGPRRPVALVIYGWSLLPVYASGVQVWPIDDALFERIYASREGFWTTIRSRDGVHHVYFVNDRSGIYALGYPALTLFDHLVHLAELTMLAVVIYVFGLALLAVFRRVARRREPGGRGLVRDVRASFYRKLLIAFVLAAVIPVLALALVIRTYFASRLRADVYAEAARTATVARHAVEELAALLRLAGLVAPPINDDLMVEVSQMIGRDVNVFDGPALVATSQRDLFASGLLPTRTPEDVYREIILQRRPTFVGEDAIGESRYMVAAAPVRATGRDAIITVPLASRQQEIEREIDELDRGLLLAVLVFVVMGAAIGLPTAERIADPVRRLTRAARRIASGDFDTRVAIRSEDELRRLVDAFNAMASELKAQQQQLERTHRLEAWAEMARQVAHEIKNPLTPIQLSAEHLRRVHADRGEPLSPVLDSCVSSILEQVRLLRQIAGEFSSFGSSPTARLGRAAVAGLLEEVTTPYRVGLPGRIDIHVDVPADLPAVIVDRTLIGRALTNVIDNALHAMPGRGALWISARHEPDAVVISVRDTGVGMDEEALARVFEPYFSTKATGTGLGLTIARRNVELSGGTITVASETGRGTTVAIRLPVAPSGAEEGPEGSAARAAP